MTGAYQVKGADQLAATLHAAGADLATLEATHRRAGETILDAARPRTPVRTGRLVSSLFATVDAAGVTVSAGAPYAAAVHAADPFLSDALKTTQTVVVGLYETAVTAAVDSVHGA